MHSKSRVDRTSSQKQTLWNDHRKSEFVENLDKEMIKNTLTSLNSMREQDEISQEQIDIDVHKISDIFNKAAKNTFKQKIPKYKKDEKNKSWFGKACNEARSGYHTAKKKYKKYPSQMNKNVLHQKSKCYKNTMNKYINEDQFKMKQKLRDLHSSKPKDFWKLINKNAKSQESEDLDINTFYEYFKKINLAQENDEDIEINYGLSDNDEILNITITQSEIEKCVKNLKDNKAHTNDNILNEHIKNTISTMSPIYEVFFNIILTMGSSLRLGWKELSDLSLRNPVTYQTQKTTGQFLSLAASVSFLLPF